MGVLDDMLDDAGGSARPASGFADLIGKAVSQSASQAAVPAADVGQLVALDDGTLARLLRYLPSDAVVPLLAHAPTALAARLVGMLDAESQAWLAAQSDDIEAVQPAQHAAAVRQAVALIGRARTAAPQASPTPKPPVTPRAPLQVGFTFNLTNPVREDGENNKDTELPRKDAGSVRPTSVPSVLLNADGGSTAGAVRTSAPSPDPVAETPDTISDDLVEALAHLVTVAAVGGRQRLAELAQAADHPVLALGLQRLAAGAEAHVLDEELRLAIHDAMAIEQRRCELMRQAILVLRFGEGPDTFRAKASAINL